MYFFSNTTGPYNSVEFIPSKGYSFLLVSGFSKIKNALIQNYIKLKKYLIKISGINYRRLSPRLLLN